MPARINQRLELAGLTLTETEYAQKPTDWHSHECPHLTLITRGEIQAGTRRAIWECPADTLLFHNRQEPHYSRKPASATRGFQVGIGLPWSRNFELSWESLPDSARLTHPGLKLLFYHIYKEARQADDASGLAIEALLIDLLATMRGVAVEAAGARPAWVARADEILRDEFAQPPSLRALSTELNLHWAHLSREFPRYFHCTFGEYIRKIRVEKSIALLRRPELPLTEIAMRCGFADQSHFIRCFRAYIGLPPKAFRKLSA